MSRRIFSVLLSVLFVALVAAPTVVMLIDDTIDVSCLYASAEEEEEGNEKSEKNKEKEVVFLELNLLETDFVLFKAQNNLEYFLKEYSKPHLNLIFSPPQLHIL